MSALICLQSELNISIVKDKETARQRRILLQPTVGWRGLLGLKKDKRNIYHEGREEHEEEIREKKQKDGYGERSNKQLHQRDKQGL